MRFFSTSTLWLTLGNAFLTSAASSWSFSDASVIVQGKGAGNAARSKESIVPGSTVVNPLSFGTGETLKIVLTAKEGKTGRRPHQAFLVLHDQDTRLEESFPFSISDSGKGKVEITHKDLPIQFLTSSDSLQASIIIGSFGSSTPYNVPAFTVDISRDLAAPISIPEKPVRYGKLPEIHHIFRSDPQSPPKIISLVFTLATLAALPALLVGWAMLGANVDHAPKAFSQAPVAHVLFFGSVVALEGVFFLYYTSWNLFQVLPAVSVVGVVAFLSGSRALTETQDRRLAGLR
ncbi:hypothetical protein P152DRAFT_96940 [Eremomyces bilateralis CBS 781.70]|uniref:Ribophorin II C-terminal domain-containing protein n=1 Tax=Eremomyces bilateralis CBS 781.70 TaxID=1392243 RepID=A0A6G1FX79_9PEZI|nr:uncharacterized protein P152DRAFT_96940 [Eremomyces bilateralis CBS 781.70]KAF1810384.1 hypothetical protein P152DRAFT_96940 [Eremomyces bilateralis CBS 781.70]